MTSPLQILSNLLNGYAEDGTEMEMDIEDRQSELWKAAQLSPVVEARLEISCDKNV